MYRRQDPDREIGEDHGDPVGEQSKFSRSVTPEDAGDAVAGRGGIYGPEKKQTQYDSGNHCQSGD